MVDPRLPLDDGHRIVGLRNWDVRGDRSVPLTEADFRAWREQLQTMENLGAVALIQRNLAVNGNVEPIDVAQMTASRFRLARVPALIGRTLVDGDEAPGAPPVAVIGHSLWQRRFLGDARVVGRSVRLGIEQTTIVGRDARRLRLSALSRDLESAPSTIAEQLAGCHDCAGVRPACRRRDG
jgi:putative ABC transport system permease protein